MTISGYVFYVFFENPKKHDFTSWSAIILLSVRLSVCLSVCLWRCALWLSRLVFTAKSCASVFLAGIFLFVPSDTFAVVYVSFSQKMHHKKTSRRNTCAYFISITYCWAAWPSFDVTLEWVGLWVRSETEEWDPIFPFQSLMGLNL